MYIANKAIFVLISVIGICAAKAGDIQVSSKTSIFSRYVGEGGSTFSQDPVVIQDFTVMKGDWYAGLWIATGLGDGSYGKTYKDDWDPYVGWSRLFGEVRYEVSATYFMLADFSQLDDDLWILDQKISLTKYSVAQPYLKVRCVNGVGKDSFEGGWFAWAGVQSTLPISKAALTLDASVAYTDGAFGKDSGLVFAKIVATLAIPVSKRISLAPSVLCQVPVDGQQYRPSPFFTKTTWVWGLSVYSKF